MLHIQHTHDSHSHTYRITLYLVSNRIQHNQWPIHAPIPSQMHILHSILIFAQIRNKNEWSEHLVRYYVHTIESYRQYEARARIVAWDVNCGVCPPFAHSQSYLLKLKLIHILHKSNMWRFFPFAIYIFQPFLYMCVCARARARENRHRVRRQQQQRDLSPFGHAYMMAISQTAILLFRWWSRICGYRNTYFYENVYERTLLNAIAAYRV